MRKIILLLAFVFTLISAQSQKLTVTGQVTDNTGPLAGATVSVKNGAIGTITDVNGKYSIKVPQGSILLFQFIGMTTQEHKAAPIINVQLKPVSVAVDEVQVVAYGQQKKVTITGAISSIKTDELTTSPSAGVGNALAGKITGITSIQSSGQPGADNATIFVRGISTLNASQASPLTIVDGVERSFSQLDPEEIADVTVLKDASATAVYGIRGANGVILVTTKRGKKGKPKISFNNSVGVQQPVRLIQMADSYTYATLRNEMSRNDGIEEKDYLFSPESIEKYKNNSEPIIYPNVNWMDYLFKKASYQYKSNLNIQGGTDRLKYFVSFGYLNQDGMFKEFNSGTNFSYKRYNYRTNVDIDVTKTSKIAITIGGRTKDRFEPNTREGLSQLFRYIYRSAPVTSPGIIDGKYVRSNPEYTGISKSEDGLNYYYGRGSKQYIINEYNFDLSFKQKLNFITKGLNLKLKASYNTYSAQQKLRSSRPDIFMPYYLKDVDSSVPQDNNEIVYAQIQYTEPQSYKESLNKGRNWYVEAALNYRRRFGKHEVGGLLLYNQRTRYYPSGSYWYLPKGYVGSAARVTYNYATKYMAEINVGYNGSENFARNKRYGLFPAISLGWIITQEDWMKLPFLNYFKLRMSYGIVGNDKIGSSRFLYLPDSYIPGGYYNFGTNVPNFLNGYKENLIGNPDVTWETATKQDYGFDIKILNNRLSINFDYFIQKRRDILTKRKVVPGLVAANLPAVNIGKVNNKGYEISLSWRDKIGKFKYWINPTVSYAKNEIIYMDEVPKNETYLYRTGGVVGQPFGLDYNGFFGENEFDSEGNLIDKSIDYGQKVQPGYVKYIDKNKDKKINSDDYQPVGYPNYPQYTFGLNSGFNVKGFDFRMSWVGATNVSRVLQEALVDPFGEKNVYALFQYMADERWTKENASSATFPLFTNKGRIYNYRTPSSLWVKDASYIRLKTVELGYNFKLRFMQQLGITKLRAFVNGYNLLTFDRMKGIVDPESTTTKNASYPIMKIYNFGVNLTF